MSEYLIISRGKCPWCSRAGALLRSLDLPHRFHDIRDDADPVRLVMKATGHHTVPLIVLDRGKHDIELIGGFEDLDAHLTKLGLLND